MDSGCACQKPEVKMRLIQATVEHFLILVDVIIGIF
jgi:hypothetical protein